MTQTIPKTKVERGNKIRFSSYPNKYNVSYEVYNKIVNDFNIAVGVEITATGSHVKLPLGLGVLVVKKVSKKVGYIPDYETYKQTNEKYILRNWHSNGEILNFKWETKFPFSDLRRKILGIPFLRFRPARGLQRAFAAHLKKNGKIEIYS